MIEFPTYNVDVGNCGECPLVKVCLQERDSLLKSKDILIDMAMDSVHDQHSEDIHSRLQMSGALSFIEEITETPLLDGPALIKVIRQQTSEMIEDFDMAAAELNGKLETFVNNCKDGPLKMLARRAGRVVTTSVCMSPLIEDGESYEEVRVMRATEEE